MVRPEQFLFKSPEQLNRQVEDVSERLGTSILPLSRREEVNTRPAEDLRREYPKRYEVYVDELRGLRTRGIGAEEGSRTRIFVLNAIDSYIASHNAGGKERTLRGYQLSVFEGLRRFLERGGEKGYIKLPSGSGKTVLFVEFAEATKLRTLIVVPTKLLVDQTEERFRQFAAGVGVGKVYGDQKDYDEQVTITTYASFIKNIREGNIDPRDYELLILDEAHKALGRRRFDLIGMFDRAIKLGFTATPKYSEDKQLRNLLPEEIHNMGVREAVELGVVSSLSVYIAKTDVDLTEIRVSSMGDYDQKDLERKLNIVRRNLAAAELYRKMFDGRSTIAYCVGIKHAMDLAEFFNRQGVKADFISGEDSREAQQVKIGLFKEGAVKVLCNADILIEGFDEPGVEVCLNLRPTLSPVIAEQRAGRVLRPDIKNPDKMAYIVDFIDGDVAGGRRVPISFAQIVEAAQVFRKTSTASIGNGKERGISHYPEIEIEGIRVITNAEEVLRLARQMEGRTSTGWLSFIALTRRYNLSESTVGVIARSLIKEKEFNDQIVFSEEESGEGYVSPELAEKFGEILKNLNNHEGWKTYMELSQELRWGEGKLLKSARKYQGEHPEWFRFSRSDTGPYCEYISPELVETLRREIGIKQEAPLGWVSKTPLARTLGVSYQLVEKTVDKHRDTHPGWVRNYHTVYYTEYLSPEMIEIVTGEIKSSSNFAPEGWKTPIMVSVALKMKHQRLLRLVEQYRVAHPEWFNVYYTKKRITSEYIAPELITIIGQKVREPQNSVPEGWLSVESLRKELSISRSKMQKIVRECRQSRPDLVKKFEPNSLTSYLSPELILIVKEELAKKFR